MTRSKEISPQRRSYLLSKRDQIKRKYITHKKSVIQYEKTELILRQCIYHLRNNNRQLADALQSQKQATKSWSDECMRLQRLNQEMHEMQVLEGPQRCDGGSSARLLQTVAPVEKSLECSLDHVMSLAQELTNIKRHFMSAVQTTSQDAPDDPTHKKSWLQYQEKVQQRAQLQASQQFTIAEEDDQPQEVQEEEEQEKKSPPKAQKVEPATRSRESRTYKRSTLGRRSKRSVCDLRLALDSDSDDEDAPHTMDITECLDSQYFRSEAVAEDAHRTTTGAPRASHRRFFKHTAPPHSPKAPKAVSLYDTQFLDETHLPHTDTTTTFSLRMSSDEGDTSGAEPLCDVTQSRENKPSVGKRPRRSKNSSSPVPRQSTESNDENVTPTLRRSRRAAAPVTLKEPSLMGKLRRT